MMRCAPLISIVAQSVSMEVILPPEMAARSGRGTPMDDALPPDLDRRPVGAHGDDLAAGDGSAKWRGTPMDDALPPDLDRRPVGAHGDDPNPPPCPNI